MTITNALTVDVEDYYHVTAFSKTIKKENWCNYESRVEKNTYRLLEIYSEKKIKGTFFVLGWVAKKYPHLVRAIAADGHEVACHGYSHQLIYNQTPKIFREETIAAKSILEEQAQTFICGYRAASYSITKRSEWALDILAEIGFVYDSSIFPTHHDLYGMPGTPIFPYDISAKNGRTIVEFPLTTLKLANYQVPVAGGGYFRLYPYLITRTALRYINVKENNPFVFYIHPWEIDPKQPRIKAGLTSRFRHYNNLDKCEKRLIRLLDDFSFSPMRDVLAGLGLLKKDDVG